MTWLAPLHLRLPGALFVTSRGGQWLPVLLAAHAALIFVVPLHAVDNVLFNDAISHLFAAACGVVPALSATAFTSPCPELEAHQPFLQRMRALWATAVFILFSAVSVLAIGGRGIAMGIPLLDASTALVALRAGALCLGLTLLAVTLVGTDYAWAPAVIYLGACILFGTPVHAITAQPWDLIHQPPHSVAAGAISATVLLAGVATYALRDRRA